MHRGVRGGGGREFSVGHWIFSHHFRFGGTEEKIDEKSMQLKLTLYNKSQSQEEIHTS